MYLFSRSRRVNPAEGREAVAKAVKFGEQATKITGHPIGVYAVVLSEGFGTVSWTSVVEHMADMTTMNDKLAANEEFNKAVEKADSLFVGPAWDVFNMLIHGGPGAGGEPPAYAQVVRAEIANGHMAVGMAGGVEIAETASRITGMQTSFWGAVTGAYAGIGWITGAPDLQAMEDANGKLMANPDWLAVVDRVSPHFNPGAQAWIAQRLS